MISVKKGIYICKLIRQHNFGREKGKYFHHVSEKEMDGSLLKCNKLQTIEDL
jgi:hypothetical protein